MVELLERYASKIRGVLSSFDRVVITGTIPQICHARAITEMLHSRGIRIFDYTKFAEPLREEIRENAERVAREAGLEIDFIQRRNFRKEERVKQIVAERGDHPGLVHIFSAMEPCSSFRPWYNKKTGKWQSFEVDQHAFNPSLGLLAELMRVRVDAPGDVWHSRFEELAGKASLIDNAMLQDFVIRCRSSYEKGGAHAGD